MKWNTLYGHHFTMYVYICFPFLCDFYVCKDKTSLICISRGKEVKYWIIYFRGTSHKNKKPTHTHTSDNQRDTVKFAYKRNATINKWLETINKKPTTVCDFNLNWFAVCWSDDCFAIYFYSIFQNAKKIRKIN